MKQHRVGCCFLFDKLHNIYKNIWEKNRMKNWKDWFIYFLFYSMIGWLYEVLLGIFVFHYGFVNRGFLFGSYCPVYGFGALLFIVLLWKVKDKKISIGNYNVTPIIIFLLITIITTVVDLVTSYVMEFAIGEWLWDYHDYAFNFEGRIALKTSIRFGIGGMIILYILHPFLQCKIKKSNPKYYHIFTYAFLIIFFN